MRQTSLAVDYKFPVRNFVKKKNTTRKYGQTKLPDLFSGQKVSSKSAVRSKARRRCTKTEIFDENKIKSTNKMTTKRLSLLPIKDDLVWKMYKKSVAAFWTTEEIDLSSDRKHFHELRKPEKDFVLFVLAFFNGADVIINENISANFIEEIESLETKCFYGFQFMMENIHSETYSLLLDTLVDDKKQKTKLLNAIHTMPSIKRKADFVNKYMNYKIPLVERLFAFVLCEGLQFSASFCAIFYLKKRGIMPGLTFSNELISRDEALHASFSALQFKRHNNNGEVNQEKAQAIVKECVAAEKNFVNNALKVSIIGMNSDLMNSYVEFIADYWLGECGFEKLYNTENPFEFMAMISLSGKTNFFEKRVGEYSKAGVGQTVKEREFALDCDF